jgi:hypothetical protein
MNSSKVSLEHRPIYKKKISANIVDILPGSTDAIDILVMAHEPQFYLLKPPGLPISQRDHLLGRIVKNYANPTADYCPNNRPCDSVSFVAPPLSSGLTNAQSVLSSSSERTAKALLTSLAALTRQKGRDAGISFSSEGIEVLRLQQHEDTFEALKSNLLIQQKLTKMLRVGGKAYFVVGLLIWKNTQFSTNQGSNKTASLTAKVPVEAALAMTAIPPSILPAVGPIQVELQASESVNSTLQATVDGEQIIGLEYRLVKRDLLGLGRNPQLTSSKMRYQGGKYYGEKRTGVEAEESSEDDDAQNLIVLTNEYIEGAVDDIS